MTEQPNQNGKNTDENKRKPINKESKLYRTSKKVKRVVQEVIDLEQDHNDIK
jgi:hypothetical protein